MRLERNLDRALSRFRPSLVGITAYTCDYNSTLSVLREVKKFDANIHTAVGGIMPRCFRGLRPAACRCPLHRAVGRLLQGVCRLEGRRPERRRRPEYRPGQRRDSPDDGPGPVSKDLDLLPFPDRSLTRQYRKRYRDNMNNKTGLIMTSRGCPFRCSFCANWKIMGGKYLARSAESVVEEIAAMPEEVELICFADDNTLLNIRRAWRLVELVRERGIRKKFMMYARADTIVEIPTSWKP